MIAFAVLDLAAGLQPAPYSAPSINKVAASRSRTPSAGVSVSGTASETVSPSPSSAASASSTPSTSLSPSQSVTYTSSTSITATPSPSLTDYGVLVERAKFSQEELGGISAGVIGGSLLGIGFVIWSIAQCRKSGDRRPSPQKLGGKGLSSSESSGSATISKRDELDPKVLQQAVVLVKTMQSMVSGADEARVKKSKSRLTSRSSTLQSSRRRQSSSRRRRGSSPSITSSSYTSRRRGSVDTSSTGPSHSIVDQGIALTDSATVLEVKREFNERQKRKAAIRNILERDAAAAGGGALPMPSVVFPSQTQSWSTPPASAAISGAYPHMHQPGNASTGQQWPSSPPVNGTQGRPHTISSRPQPWHAV